MACACDAGWKGDGQTCDDVDECLDQLDNCHATATCTNTDGSFTCACPPGTVGDPLTGCEARYSEITAGLYHTCARRLDDAAVCFGNGGSGRLGNGLSVNQAAPVQVGAASNWAHLSAGTSHTCGIKKTGNLWCWGNNGFGQLGLGNNVSQTLPAFTSLDRTWTSVAAGENHSCAVESDGTLSCWGRNAAGQLATGSANPFEYSPVHVNVDPLAVVAETDWKEVFAGRDSTCALKQSGALYCWGQNSDLQISKPGAGFVAIPYLVATTPMGMDTDWATVSVGVTTCGLKKVTGAMWCWGRGAEGQLGNGTIVGSAAPVAVSPGAAWTAVRAGTSHVCGLQAGALYCWGRNQGSQIANGQSGWLLAPTAIGSDTDWTALAGGAVHTCGLKQDGHVLCWGSRVYGQTGDGATSLHTLPQPIGALTTWTLAASFGETSCALGPAGMASCWGNNENGQLGLGDTASRDAPADVTTASGFSRLVMGRQFACGVTLAGGLVCTGRNAAGQLGTASVVPSMKYAPIVTAGKPYAALTWKELAAGEEHACSIAGDASLWCWGRNSEGQLGQTVSPTTGTLAQVLPLDVKNWTAVAAGQFHTCARRADTSIWCWGRNVEGQLGAGVPGAGKIAPASVGLGFGNALAAGVNHTCAIKLDGTLWCWGKNSNSQLGDGTVVDEPAPVQVGLDTDWAQVTAGNAATCARKTGGSLWCWGANSGGQLGLGDLGQRKAPVVVGAALWTDVHLGYLHTCAVRSDGALVCWGSGELGQNGIGDGFLPGPTLLAAVK
jgi:alpha-tubulin suppressor-like RCC1 family protein